MAGNKRKKICLGNWIPEIFPIVLRTQLPTNWGADGFKYVTRGREFGYDKRRPNGSMQL